MRVGDESNMCESKGRRYTVPHVLKRSGLRLSLQIHSITGSWDVYRAMHVAKQV